MIGKLYGIIDDIEQDHIILNVNNVGYIVYMTENSLKNLNTGNNLSLFIETYLREDQIKLYGFLTKQEVLFLRTLVKVKGISYKIASNMIGNISADQIIQAINSKNPALLKVNGVGTKLANRVITELEGAFDGFNFKHSNDLTNDAISALIHLGYNANTSYNMVNKALKKHPQVNNINELITLSLNE